MLKTLITILFLAPVWVCAQVTISGKVIAHEGKAPIEGASVFLSNTEIRGGSAADGGFVLKNVRNGQYDLVVSHVGYEPYHKDVMVIGNEAVLPDIELMPKVNMLKEVAIGKAKPSTDRPMHLRWFTREFLGESPNARQCKILNTEVIDLRYSKRSGTLRASSDDFIIVENRALGYTIKYLLHDFSLNGSGTKVFFAGASSFEPLKGTPEEEKVWEEKRIEVFTGSTMHFLRSSLHNQLIEEKFTVTNEDGKKITEQELLRRTDKDGVYALTSPKDLWVRHGKKASRDTELMFNDKYVFFDLNGVILNPQSNTMRGFWGRQRIAELLPVDYRRPTDFP